MNLPKRSMAVLVCMVALTAAACSTSGKAGPEITGGPGDPTTTTTGGGGSTTTEAKTTTTTAKTTTTEAKTTTTTSTSKEADVAVVESGFSVYEVYDGQKGGTAAAVLENTGGTEAVFFDVVFTFLDAKDKPVATQTAYVYHLAPGAKGNAVVEYVELSGDVKSIDVTPIVSKSSYVEGASLDVEVGSVGKESYGEGVLIKGTAKNDTDAVLEGYEVACVLRTKKKIVGGATGYLDKIVPGKSIAWEARGSVPADAADCSASAIL